MAQDDTTGDTIPHYSQIEDGARNLICPPNVVGMMTGTIHASQGQDGSITLLYKDGTEETADANLDLVTEFDDYFSVVTYVQDKRIN